MTSGIACKQYYSLVYIGNEAQVMISHVVVFVPSLPIFSISSGDNISEVSPWNTRPRNLYTPYIVLYRSCCMPASYLVYELCLVYHGMHGHLTDRYSQSLNTRGIEKESSEAYRATRTNTSPLIFSLLTTRNDLHITRKKGSL